MGPQKISSEESLPFLQLLRAKFDALVVGPSTFRYDKPNLDYRSLPGNLDFRLVNSDASLGAKLFSSFLLLQDIAFDDEYQPFRIFLIATDEPYPHEWIAKQKKIHGPKPIFWEWKLDSESRIGTKTWMQQEMEKEGLTFQSFGKNDGKDFVESLAELGCNTVLLESGNFLRNWLGDVRDEEDLDLLIQNQELVIKNGMTLDWNQDKKPIWEARAGSDVLSLFTGA